VAARFGETGQRSVLFCAAFNFPPSGAEIVCSRFGVERLRFEKASRLARWKSFAAWRQRFSPSMEIAIKRCGNVDDVDQNGSPLF
jgi:hypothetical protein